MPPTHVHPITIYYEDTDFTGYVYHANYLKFFERAREHLLGVERLARMYRETGVGFVVYKAELTFKEPAVHGDQLEIRTVGRAESDYRCVFDHQVWKAGGAGPIVTGVVQMVAVDKAGKLVLLPEDVLGWLRSGTGPR